MSGLVIAYSEYLKIVLEGGESGVAILVSKICGNNNNKSNELNNDSTTKL